MNTPISQIASAHQRQMSGAPDVLMKESQAAKILCVSPRALQKWRSNGRGPPFVRISARCIRYRMKDLAKWTTDRLRQSTSDVRSQLTTNIGDNHQ